MATRMGTCYPSHNRETTGQRRPPGWHVLDRNDELRDALKRAASAFKAHGPGFALGGSYALWVYGAPEPVHDVDFVVAQVDAEAAEVTL